MNCSEFRDSLAAHTEGLIEPDAAADFEHHRAACSACRLEHAAFTALHEQLTARGASAAAISIAAPVLRRIREPDAADRPVWSRASAVTRWILGASVAAAAAIAVVAVLTFSPQIKAQAADVMSRGATAAAQVKTVHLQGRMRTAPHDNFSYLNPKLDFCRVELWRELGGQKRWRIEKPGRVAANNGSRTAMVIRPQGPAIKVDRSLSAPFDTGWLQSAADIEQLLSNALKLAQTQGWKMELSSATDASGATLKLVTIDTPSGVRKGDYLENKFLSTAATRRLFSFDDATGQLKALRIYILQDADYLLAFEVTQIDHDVALADDLFTLELPPGATWTDLPEPGVSRKVANNERYAALSPEQAARAFFEACGREDWNEAAVFIPFPLNDRMKAGLAGLSVVQIGAAFTSDGNPGTRFVPYEIRGRDGRVRKHNLALKHPPEADRWLVDGGL